MALNHYLQPIFLVLYQRAQVDGHELINLVDCVLEHLRRGCCDMKIERRILLCGFGTIGIPYALGANGSARFFVNLWFVTAVSAQKKHRRCHKND
jgi:hypothetical protein